MINSHILYSYFFFINIWFAKIDVKEFEWPAQGPDLNPTKHVWDELEC